MNELLAILSVIVISLISIIAIIPILLHKKLNNKFLVNLLSLSVGVILATVFINFLPEIYHEHENYLISGLTILLGFLIMFILEKFIHIHHSKKEHKYEGHSHAYTLAPINLIGDGFHNFIDGLIIAASYLTNVTLGITATISIIIHELPQEIADFGVLLYSGMSKKKAILFNFLSATTAILGTIIGLLLSESEHFVHLLLPFATGNFIYIAASNLTPQLHRHCNLKDSIKHILCIILGIVIVVLIAIILPHSH